MPTLPRTVTSPQVTPSPSPSPPQIPDPKAQAQAITLRSPPPKTQSTQCRRPADENTQEVPGPGAYDTGLEIGGPKYKISQAQRYFERKHTLPGPGPGAYTIKSQKDTPSYSMIAKRSISSHEQNAGPGPGSYSPNSGFTMITYSIGRSEESRLLKKATPGPGSYSLTLAKAPGTSIGTGNRPPLSLVLDTPGPGSYNAFSSFGAPAYSISGREQVKKTDPEPVRNM